MHEEEPKLYRSRKGVLFGVCAGLARWRALPVFWLRLLAIILFIFTGGVPMLTLYIAAALIMKPEPEEWQYIEAAEAKKKQKKNDLFVDI